MTAPRDDGVEAEQELVGRLFARLPGDDPHALLHAASLPGCRYYVVDALLRDARFGPRRVDPSPEPVWQMFARWLISLDGERHRRIRRHFQRLFTPRQVDRFRGAIRSRATELVDAVATRGEMDLVTEFARPLPLSVILEILGVPPDRHDWLRERMLKLGQGFARRQEAEFVARASEAVTEMLAFFSAQIDERSDTPRDDLLSVLATSIPEDEDGRPDVLANCIFFIEAGHATTTSLISAGTLLLLEHPRELDRLRDQPSLIPLAIEEMLRLVTPVTLAICSPREDVTLAGYRFQAEVPRFAFLAAANRDHAVFPEPGRFDIDRDPGHLAFSAGSHFCLGAPLARLHGEIALTTLLARLPGLRAAGDPDWRGFVPLHELEHLPVAWDLA
jgi:pimeloyl-[acyl-carrier protein] synthase